MSYTENRDAIGDFSMLYNKDGSQHYDITIKSTVKGQYIVAIKDIDTKEQAGALRNIEIYAQSSELPDIDETDLFYINSLIGLNVQDASTNDSLGTVKGVHNFGAGDIIDIQPEEGKSFMLLFTPENFPTIALDDGFMTCSMPELLKAKED